MKKGNKKEPSLRWPFFSLYMSAEGVALSTYTYKHLAGGVK